MPFFSRWRATHEEDGSQAGHDDDRVRDGAHSSSIDAAEQDHRALGLQRAQAQAQAQSLSAHNAPKLNSARPGGEEAGEGFSLDPPASNQPRRVGFESGLAKGPAAQGPPIARLPAIGPSRTAAEAQSWRWLLQQEELNSLPPAPQTAAEANAVRRQAAEQLDLSTVKREELHLLSAEELGALDELAYGGDVLQSALQAEEQAGEAAAAVAVTKGDFALATLLQQLEEEEAAAEEESGDEDEDEEGDEERQVARAMELTAEEQEEEDEWKQVERAMRLAAEQEAELPACCGAGIGADIGACIGADIGAGIGAGIGGRWRPPTPAAPTAPEQDELLRARALVEATRRDTQASACQQLVSPLA